jgi:Cd2+/Zn2+-exporting ATPase
VRAGETVPLDGVVVSGKSTCTLEHLTGESTPVVKRKGESVPGGARNLEGLLIVKVRLMQLLIRSRILSLAGVWG